MLGTLSSHALNRWIFKTEALRTFSVSKGQVRSDISSSVDKNFTVSSTTWFAKFNRFHNKTHTKWVSEVFRVPLPLSEYRAHDEEQVP